MKKLLSVVKIKWLAYILELLIIFTVQNAPGLLPSFLGVKPLLLVIFAVSIAMFEGDVVGLWFGIIAGFLMDLSASTVFGFYTLFVMIICYICGTLVIYLMRNNLVSSLVLGALAVLALGLVQWLFQFAIWGDSGTWYFLYGVLLPRVIYSAAIMPLAFYFNRALASHLASDE